MKLNYKNQMILAVGIVVAFYLIMMVTGNRIFRGIGLCLSGLLYAIHPVVQEGEEDNKKLKSAVRFAGVFLVLIGLFT